MSARETVLRWRYMQEEMPPESRIVLLLITHWSAPGVMRRHAIGSWRTLNGTAAWSVDGLADYEKWGWYLIAWAELPPVEDLPECEPRAEVTE